jgi:hypothetical protein
MAFIIDTFTITDDQYLGRFVRHPKAVGDLIGDETIAQQVEEIKVDIPGLGISFQATFYQGAGGTAGTMLKDHLGTLRRPLANLI